MNVILISGKAQHGKDTTSEILQKIIEADNKKVLIMHYADLLKYICKSYFNWNGIKDDNGRTILQYVGTDIIRKQSPNFWVSFVIEFLSLFTKEWDYVIIPDTRFPNEIDEMAKAGIKYGWNVFSVRVTRIDFDNGLSETQQNHISETALDNYKFDYYIDTINDLSYLTQKVMNMYEYFKCAKEGDM